MYNYYNMYLVSVRLGIMNYALRTSSLSVIYVVFVSTSIMNMVIFTRRYNIRASSSVGTRRKRINVQFSFDYRYVDVSTRMALFSF